MRRPEDKGVAPFVSVVIPTRGRLDKLRACLSSIAALDYPRDNFEVIVVDDGSSQPVQPAVSSFGAEFTLRTIRQSWSGPAAARNKGLDHASGSLVAFTDDDCQPRTDWLQRLVDGHQVDPEAALGGRVLNALPDRPCSEASQLLVDYLYQYYGTRTGGAGFFTSNNLAFPTKTLRRIGGFDVTFPLAAGEDRELCYRWRSLGLPIVYVPDALVDHAHDLNFRRFCRQHFNYGRGAWHFHRTMSKQMGRPVKLEPARFYAGMMLYPFRKQTLSRSISGAWLIASSQVANALGFVYEQFRAPKSRPKGGADEYKSASANS